MPFPVPSPDAPAELSDAPISELDLPADLPGDLYVSDEHENDQAYPTESAFPPDPFSEPSPPHVPYPHPEHASPSSPSSTKKKTPKCAMGSPPHPDGASPPPSPMYMKLGTLIVMGAIAANVFGFRYSRWAVGKDIHRAWERHQRNANTRAAGAEGREARRRASEAAGRERRERVRREEERRRMKVEEVLRRDREQRERTRGSYEGWEGRFERSGGGPNTKTLEDLLREMSGMMGGVGPGRSGQGEFDARVVEEMMRQMGGMMGGMGMGRRVRVEFDSRRAEEMMNAFLRAGGQARRGQQQQQQEFDAFRFWERMEGARWRHGGGGGAEGVFGRAGMTRHYSALGVEAGAPQEEVKTAYRKLAMKWHPDRYKGADREQAERRFREITEAYEALMKK